MIKVEKIFPEVVDDTFTMTRITDDTPPGLMAHVVLKKGATTPLSYHKTAKNIVYILKGELEVIVVERVTGRKVDFRATDGMLLRIPPNVSTSFKALKETSYLTGSDITGRDDANKLDFEFEKNPKDLPKNLLTTM